MSEIPKRSAVIPIKDNPIWSLLPKPSSQDRDASLLINFLDLLDNTQVFYQAKGESWFNESNDKAVYKIGQEFVTRTNLFDITDDGIRNTYTNFRSKTEYDAISDDENVAIGTVFYYASAEAVNRFKKSALKNAEAFTPLTSSQFEAVMQSIERNQVILDSAIAEMVVNYDNYISEPTHALMCLLAQGATGFYTSDFTLGGTSWERHFAVDFPYKAKSGKTKIKTLIMPTHYAWYGVEYVERELTEPLEGYSPLIDFVPREGFEPS